MPTKATKGTLVWVRLYTNSEEDSTRDTIWNKPDLFSTLAKAKRGIRGWTNDTGTKDCWYTKDNHGGVYTIQHTLIDAI